MRSLASLVLFLSVLLLSVVPAAVPYLAPTPAPEASAAVSQVAYKISGTEFEGCECNVYCQCNFSLDATFDQCRSLSAWQVAQGSYGNTDLKGVVFAASITKSGKNIDRSMGQLEGILFLPQSASKAQQDAIKAIMANDFGPAFAKLDTRIVPIEVKLAGEQYSVKVGDIANLQISALKNAAGKLTTVENAPSPIAPPKYTYAKADVNTYNDGVTTWDFAGRNASYEPFEMASK